ncbi:MAG: hypothetical protein MJ252_27345, partial [archaeon]|nr:hypothetical protein [archaeon]
MNTKKSSWSSFLNKKNDYVELLEGKVKKEFPSENGEEIFKAYDFQLECKEEQLLSNIEISSAKVKSPIDNETEEFIGIQFKSKYDRIGVMKEEESIDVSLAIDISGSMKGDRFVETKMVIKSMIETIGKNDKVALT